MSIAFDSGLPKTTALAGSSVYLSSLGWSDHTTRRLFGESVHRIPAVVRRFRTAASFTVATPQEFVRHLSGITPTREKKSLRPAQFRVDQATTTANGDFRSPSMTGSWLLL